MNIADGEKSVFVIKLFAISFKILISVVSFN